jgi:hypothetical protein
MFERGNIFVERVGGDLTTEGTKRKTTKNTEFFILIYII